MTLLRSMVVGLTLLSGLHGQTFIVDASNGPGTNFTSLPVAVAAVPDGATLRVRPGLYTSFTLSNKGLTILGEPGVRILDAGVTVTVTSTQPAQPVVISGVWFLVNSGMNLANCQGPVLLEGVQIDSRVCAQPMLTANSCAQLAMRGCILSQIQLVNSHVSLESCTITGINADCYGLGPTHCRGGTPAVWAIGGTTQIVGCMLQGGRGIYAFNGIVCLRRPSSPVAPWRCRA